MRIVTCMASLILGYLTLLVFTGQCEVCVWSDRVAAAEEAQTELETPGTKSAVKPVDVMLVLDNSGSMKENDPNALMREVVLTFATRLGPDARLGMVLFADQAEMIMPLTFVGTSDFKDQIAERLERLDYRGWRTDIPAGIERALYELRAEGLYEAERVLVFLTDGKIEVGGTAQNLERARWLEETLAQEAKRLGIRIFGIAFTESADFHLIQSMAEKTDGGYFRVLEASNVGETFNQINTRIREITQPDSAPDTTAQPSVVAEHTWQPWGLAAAGTIVLIIAAVIIAKRRQRIVVPSAALYDLGGHTGKDKHAIAKAVIRIGRQSESNDIVISQDQSTVSRQHVEIVFRDGTFYLRDLRSSNGTWVNRKQMSDPEAIREVPLKHRDRIRFGLDETCEFEFAVAALEAGQQTRYVSEAVPGATRPQPAAPERPVREEKVQAEAPSPGAVNEPIPDVTRPQPAAPQEPVREAKAQAETPQSPDAAERPTKVKNERCPRHPSWKATELCTTCERAWCEYCINEQDGKIVCVECVSKAPSPGAVNEPIPDAARPQPTAPQEPVRDAKAQPAAAPSPDAAERPTKVKNEMCSRHPSWKATELCTTCERAWCEYCINEQDGKIVCVECIRKNA